MKARRNSFVSPKVAIVMVSLAAAGIGHAAPHPPKDEATRLHEQGEVAAEAGHLGEAVDAWRKSWALRPDDPLTACNIGRCELRRTDYREAALWLTRCIRLTPKPTTPEEVATSKQYALELLTATQRISAVTFNVDEPDTRIVVDDETIRVSPVHEDVFLEPGVHRIQAYKGLRTTEMTLSTAAGKEYQVAVFLPRLPPLEVDWSKIPIPPPPTPPTPLTFRWWPVALGGALVGTGVLAGLGLSVASGGAADEATGWLSTIQAEGKSCTNPPIDPRCAAYDRYESRSATYSTAAIATFVAAGAITAGVIGYAIYENNRVSVSPTLSGFVGRYQW